MLRARRNVNKHYVQCNNDSATLSPYLYYLNVKKFFVRHYLVTHKQQPNECIDYDIQALKLLNENSNFSAIPFGLYMKI